MDKKNHLPDNLTEIVKELRTKACNGDSALQLLNYLIDIGIADPELHFIYFREAFSPTMFRTKFYLWKGKQVSDENMDSSLQRHVDKFIRKTEKGGAKVILRLFRKIKFL